MPTKVITIAQQKGGAGKTTIAAHLAIAFSQRKKRVALIDIDPQASLTEWYRIREEKFGADYTGIEFANVSGWRLNNEIDELQGKVDVIIIDSPPHTQSDTKSAIRIADLVLIPVQPSPTDVWSTEDTINIVSRERVPHRVLFNRVTPNTNLFDKFKNKFQNRLDTVLGNRVAFVSSIANGTTATESFPSSIAAQEIKNFASDVASLLFPLSLVKREEEAEASEAQAKSKKKAKQPKPAKSSGQQVEETANQNDGEEQEFAEEAVAVDSNSAEEAVSSSKAKAAAKPKKKQSKPKKSGARNAAKVTAAAKKAKPKKKTKTKSEAAEKQQATNQEVDDLVEIVASGESGSEVITIGFAANAKARKLASKAKSTTVTTTTKSAAKPKKKPAAKPKKKAKSKAKSEAAA